MFHQDIQPPRSGLKKGCAAKFVFNLLRGVWIPDVQKHFFEFLIWILKPFTILGEMQSKSSQNVMLIKIWYPNHRHGSEFPLFFFFSMNC